MTWNLSQLRDDVATQHGEAQRDQLAPSLNSIVDRQTYARFHFQEAARILKELLEDRDDRSVLIDIVFGADREAHHEFANSRKFAEAHITACLQSLHSLSDILAHTIYYALGLNLDDVTKLHPNRIYLHVVKPLLPAGKMSTLIQELVEHADYRYLADIVNHSKHRSVVQTPYTVDVTGTATPPHGLKFAAFTYGSRAYPARWVASFVESEYNRHSDLITRIGELLNDLVREQGYQRNGR
jgi:hypothetical protein